MSRMIFRKLGVDPSRRAARPIIVRSSACDVGETMLATLDEADVSQWSHRSRTNEALDIAYGHGYMAMMTSMPTGKFMDQCLKVLDRVAERRRPSRSPNGAGQWRRSCHNLRRARTGRAWLETSCGSAAIRTARANLGMPIFLDTHSTIKPTKVPASTDDLVGTKVRHDETSYTGAQQSGPKRTEGVARETARNGADQSAPKPVHGSLDHGIGVRIPASQPNKSFKVKHIWDAQLRSLAPSASHGLGVHIPLFKNRSTSDFSTCWRAFPVPL
jgi:hypothetical protein